MARLPTLDGAGNRPARKTPEYYRSWLESTTGKKAGAEIEQLAEDAIEVLTLIERLAKGDQTAMDDVQAIADDLAQSRKIGRETTDDGAIDETDADGWSDRR